MANSYKRHKRGAPPFTMLYEWFQSSEAWASLKPGPRALYIEIKRNFNGANNGKLFLSHRDAGKALNVGRDTVGGYYKDLVDHGFLKIVQGHCLGPSGKGQSAIYALTEEPLDGKPATKDFMAWKKKKPR